MFKTAIAGMSKEQIAKQFNVPKSNVKKSMQLVRDFGKKYTPEIELPNFQNEKRNKNLEIICPDENEARDRIGLCINHHIKNFDEYTLAFERCDIFKQCYVENNSIDEIAKNTKVNKKFIDGKYSKLVNAQKNHCEILFQRLTTKKTLKQLAQEYNTSFGDVSATIFDFNKFEKENPYIKPTVKPKFSIKKRR